MPRVDAATMRRLREAAAGRDGAFLSTPTVAASSPVSLDAARLAGVRPGLEEQHGMALHRLLAPLDLADVPAIGDEAIDIDTWADLRDLRMTAVR